MSIYSELASHIARIRWSRIPATPRPCLNPACPNTATAKAPAYCSPRCRRKAIYARRKARYPPPDLPPTPQGGQNIGGKGG